MNLENLKKHCGDLESEKIGTPWSEGEYSFATNGFTLVRVSRLPEVPGRKNIPNYKAVLELTPEPVDGWQAVASLESFGIKECPWCKGKIREPAACEECHGEGEVSWDNHWHTYEATCRGCDGDGKTNLCTRCGNHGYILPQEIIIGQHAFTPSYLIEFLKMPGLEVSLPPDIATAVWFRWGSGHALIMPRRPADALAS